MAPTLTRPHLVWDWNCTLADDVERHVEALNAALPPLGARRIDLATFRRLFSIPIPDFYAAVLGRPLTAQEWQQADTAFQSYLANCPPVRLLPGAADLLARLIRAGCTHSVLSLSAHATLTRQITALEIAHLFIRTDGRTGAPGGTKVQALAVHVADLRPSIGNHRPVVIIGDAADDAHAATANGLPAVLYAGGLTGHDALSRVGVPVADTLAQAAALALTRANAARPAANAISGTTSAAA